MSIRRVMPSLNTLVVLEAAVRKRSFTAAAAELGVTQAAVSRQIAMLEAELGTPLFVRRHRAVEPTPGGLLLATSLAMNFASIAESVAMVRSSAAQPTITIGATLAFSTFWLLPRIGEFRKRYPAAQIRVVSQDSRIDLGRGEVDVAVRFGLPPFDDGVILASRSDEIFPVCSPDFAQRLAPEAMTFRGTENHLIGQEVPDRSWYAWQDWFARAGIKDSHSQPHLIFNHYTDAVQAARAGQGIALGWAVLVQGFIEDGSLLRVGETVVSAEGRYNVLVPQRRKANPLGDLFVEWLAGQLC